MYLMKNTMTALHGAVSARSFPRAPAVNAAATLPCAVQGQGCTAPYISGEQIGGFVAGNSGILVNSNKCFTDLLISFVQNFRLISVDNYFSIG